MGGPPPWVLEYAKRGIGRAVQEAARKAAETVLAGGTPPEKVSKKKQSRKDLASDEQTERTIQKLKDLGFTDIKLPKNGAYFSQGDKRWANLPFPKLSEVAAESTRTLREAGCGPTTLAIAIATLRPDRNVTPRDIGQYAVDQGYTSPRSRPSGSGADMSMVKPLAKDYGLASVKIDSKDPAKIDKMREGLKNGGVALVHVGGGVFNYPKGHPERKPKGGHWIAVNGYAVDKDGKEWFFVANPGKDGSAVTVEDRALIVDRDLQHHGAGMVRVSRETLEGLMKESYMVSDPAAAPAAPASGSSPAVLAS